MSCRLDQGLLSTGSDVEDAGHKKRPSCPVFHLSNAHFDIKERLGEGPKIPFYPMDWGRHIYPDYWIAVLHVAGYSLRGCEPYSR